MEVSAIRVVVMDAVKRGRIERREAEDALSRIESAEAEQAKVQNDPNATEPQTRDAFNAYNEASAEAADLINRI